MPRALSCSISTGLVPSAHGIIANDFWDSELQESFFEAGVKQRDGRFWRGEPVCVATIQQRPRYIYSYGAPVLTHVWIDEVMVLNGW
jgi:hypothetical protein